MYTVIMDPSDSKLIDVVALDAYTLGPSSYVNFQTNSPIVTLDVDQILML